LVAQCDEARSFWGACNGNPLDLLVKLVGVQKLIASAAKREVAFWSAGFSKRSHDCTGSQSDLVVDDPDGRGGA
jgi:hypothetical protein